jgi:outer membrane protein TolC
MNKYLLLYCAMWLSVPMAALSQSMPSTPVELTLEEAYRRMLHANKTLQIADQGVAMAQSEYRKTAGTWWPSLQARGAYVAMANDIGVDFTLLEHTFSFPLIRQHLSDISLSLTWPVFAGGRRLLGTSLARQGIHLARLQRLNTQASLQTTLVAAYYALYLTHHVTQVRYAAYQSLRRHYAEARQLEAQGMLTHADCLYARLCQDEAEREWQDSERQRQVAHRALGTLLGEAETHSLQPVSPLLRDGSIPFVLTVAGGNGYRELRPADAADPASDGPRQAETGAGRVPAHRGPDGEAICLRLPSAQEPAAAYNGGRGLHLEPV